MGQLPWTVTPVTTTDPPLMDISIILIHCLCSNSSFVYYLCSRLFFLFLGVWFGMCGVGGAGGVIIERVDNII